MAFGLAPPRVAWAQGAAVQPDAASLGDLSLQELMGVRVETVSGASKYEQKVTRAPASVSIVTGDEIAAFGHRSLAEVLRSVRGLYVSDDSNYAYLGSRGFLRPGDYNTRTLVLVDGHRMNDNVYDEALYGREGLLDVEDIDRVEIIRGPSSSVYGNSAFFGVVNIVPVRGRQLDGWDASVAAASFGTTEGRLRFGRLLPSELEVVLSLSCYRSDGRGAIYYPEFDERISSDPRAAHQGVASDRDGEDAVKARASVKYHGLTVSGFVSSRDKDVPTASFLSTFNRGREMTTDRRGYLDARYECEISPRLRFMSRAAYDSYKYFGDYPTDDGHGGVIVNRDETVGEWLTGETQVTAVVGAVHTFVGGVEYRENLHEKQVNYDDLSPRQYWLDDDHADRQLGAYAQGEIALASNLLLNGGIRYDRYFDTFGGTWNPRIGLIANVAERTTVKALYGQAFRAPNRYEEAYYEPLQRVPLVPERIRTYELALEQYFAGDYRATVSLYRYHVYDLISFVGSDDGDAHFENGGHCLAHGAEFGFEGRFARKVQVRASYAVQRVEDEETKLELTSSPRQMAKLNVRAPLYRDDVTGGFELQYLSRMRTVAGPVAGGFAVGNLTVIARRLPGGFELAGSVYNVFDRRYGYSGAQDHIQTVIPQPGRTFRLKLTCRF